MMHGRHWPWYYWRHGNGTKKDAAVMKDPATLAGCSHVTPSDRGGWHPVRAMAAVPTVAVTLLVCRTIRFSQRRVILVRGGASRLAAARADMQAASSDLKWTPPANFDGSSTIAVALAAVRAVSVAVLLVAAIDIAGEAQHRRRQQ